MLDRDIAILRKLLEASPNFISGNVLAQKLGISRVAVWARLEKLRELGFDFEAIRRRGYRLIQEPPELNAALLRAYLKQADSGARILFFPEIDSTNTEAERQLAGGRQTPFVILASKQKRGRGRFGRKWYSPEDGNCYMSFVFRPKLPPQHMQLFTFWMGLYVCQLLNDSYNLSVRIKWPNDLVLNQKKAGGILTEARVDVDCTRDLIFGLGLNVNCYSEQWPPELAVSATSLAATKGRSLPLNSLAADLVETGLRAYEDFCRDNYQSKLHGLWSRYDAIRGQIVTVNNETESLIGSAEGIDAEGALRLRLEDNRVVKLRAGEVTLGSDATVSHLSL